MKEYILAVVQVCFSSPALCEKIMKILLFEGDTVQALDFVQGNLSIVSLKFPYIQNLVFNVSNFGHVTLRVFTFIDGLYM